MPPRTSFAAAARAVAATDPVLAEFMARAGPFRLRPPRGDAFGALTASILYQQLAGRAAAAIHARFLALFDGPPSPGAVLAVPPAALRSAGLSAAKAAAIRDLAAKVLDGTVPMDGWGLLSDEEVVERLVAVRGIGRWTAEMFLIFDLRRLDVWPATDHGVRKGWARIQNLAALPGPRQLSEAGDRFRPYRTVVAWYCWRAVDTVTPGA